MNKYYSIPLLLVVLLVMLACSLFGTPTPVPTNRPTNKPTQSQALLPTEAPQPATFLPTSPEPQPAAAPRLQAGDEVKLDLIAMKSATKGWGISGSVVLTTSDGGKTWSEATPPESLAFPASASAYGVFLDAQTAWVIYSQDDMILSEASVWHTTDTGRTWTPGPPLYHQVYGDVVWAELFALDAHNAWVMVRGVYVGAGTHYVHNLFRTHDSGVTWTPLDEQFSGDYTAMIFTDEGFGVRTLETLGAYYFDPPTFTRTLDGGATWAYIELPPPSDFPDLFDTYPYCETYQPVLLSDRSIRMLLGCMDNEYSVEDFVSYFYASEDAGATWQTTRLPAQVEASQYQLVYFGREEALLLGRSIYRSTTDGQDWDYVSMVNWDGQFSFIDAQTGWAVGKDTTEVAIAYTDDGADSWSLIIPTIKP